MNKYLLPVAEHCDVWIESVSARSMEDAENKFMMSLIETYQDKTLKQIPDDSWDKFLDFMLNEFDVIIGDIYDIEEF